jgi:hypothetical protein
MPLRDTLRYGFSLECPLAFRCCSTAADIQENLAGKLGGVNYHVDYMVICGYLMLHFG